MNTLKTWAAAAALVALSGAAQAALIGQSSPSGDTVKDDSTNLVWLQDWSYSGAPKTWASANLWSSGLDYGGYSDWRLPELGEYQALWAAAGSTTSGLLTYFINVADATYWTNTTFLSNAPWGPGIGPEPQTQRLLFDTYDGSGGGVDAAGNSFATMTMAVRDGDVTAAVPEPGSMALAGLALVGLVCTRRRQR